LYGLAELRLETQAATSAVKATVEHELK